MLALADVSDECAQAAGRLREPNEEALVQPMRSPVVVQQVRSPRGTFAWAVEAYKASASSMESPSRGGAR
jgi:hypothetical protein